MELDMGTVSQLKSDADLSALFALLFDPEVSVRTRLLVAAVLACVVPQVRSIRESMTTVEFFADLKALIAGASPDSLLWLSYSSSAHTTCSRSPSPYSTTPESTCSSRCTAQVR
jgi:hypothetical protein